MLQEVTRIRRELQAQQVHDLDYDLHHIFGEIKKIEEKIVKANEDSLLVIQKVHQMLKEYS